MSTTRHDLAELTTTLGAKFVAVQELYLFGSRRYGTRSPRSDIDVLVVTNDHIRAAEMRAFAAEHCPALDLFLVSGGSATSAQNESHVHANTFAELVARLDAVLIWSRDRGAIVDAGVDLRPEIADGIEFPPSALITGLPVESRWAPSFNTFLRTVEEGGLPSRPFIGSTASDVAGFLVEVIRRAVGGLPPPATRGAGTQVKLLSEYDFQNLFYLSMKPWLPSLGREEVTVIYDGANKKADFHACNTRIIVELKHIKDANTKAAVLKTLEGLATFYLANAQVEVLLFLVLVDRDVDVDGARIESDFSSNRGTRCIWTRVIRNGA